MHTSLNGKIPFQSPLSPLLYNYITSMYTLLCAIVVTMSKYKK